MVLETTEMNVITQDRENGLKRERDKEPAKETEMNWFEVSRVTEAKSFKNSFFLML